MEIVLTSTSDDLSHAWRLFCGHYPGVRIHGGSILDVPCDAVVSPANSFGFMDGGIDALYLERFGHALQDSVQDVIHHFHGGELLVGAAEIVETGDSVIPFLVVAPTMRVPMILRETVNPYLAARAVFRLLRHGTIRNGRHAGAPVREVVRSVAFPGLGTGVGQVSPNICARQVAQAIDDALLQLYSPPRTWAEASARHQELSDGRPRRLQSEVD